MEFLSLNEEATDAMSLFKQKNIGLLAFPRIYTSAKVRKGKVENLSPSSQRHGSPLYSGVNTGGASPQDLRYLVLYLQHFPDGLAIKTLDVTNRKYLTPQKLQDYQQWGIIIMVDGGLRLTSFGNALAHSFIKEALLYRKILARQPQFHSVLEFMRQGRHAVIKHSEIQRYLLDHQNDATDRMNIMQFFQLCQAAGLGTITMGKRGQESRLTVDLFALQEYYRSTESV